MPETAENDVGAWIVKGTVELNEDLAHLGSASIGKHDGTNHRITENAVSSSAGEKARLEHQNILPVLILGDPVGSKQTCDTGISSGMMVAKPGPGDEAGVQVGINAAIQALNDKIVLVEL